MVASGSHASSLTACGTEPTEVEISVMTTTTVTPERRTPVTEAGGEDCHAVVEIVAPAWKIDAA